MKNMEFISLGFEIKDITERKESGVPVGIVTGYLATWDIDRGKDRFEKGAFQESLAEHRQKSRMIRMKAYHDIIIGGFPIDPVREDEKGLYVEGHINLETTAGREAYALAKQGVLSDFSIGYSVNDSEYESGIRVIKRATIWEGSIVDEPMNEHANINEVKTVNPRAKLPKQFADRAYRWDAVAADKRVRTWAGADEAPTDKYKTAFLWYANEGDNFAEYKLQIADVVDGSLKLVPRAIFAVRAVLAGARGGAKIPAADQAQIKSIINTLYTEMEMETPFTDGGKSKAYCTTELKNMQRSILFDAVRFGELSKNATEQLINAVNNGESLQTSDEIKKLKSAAVLEGLEELKNIFKGVK
jgi:HK97 family phage prohead protease